MPKFSVIILLSCTLLLLSSPTSGQGNLGAITGTIQDPSGAVVPDLPLTITNVETGVKWTATTSSAGYYRVAVPPGTYGLEAQKQGFKTQVVDKILVPKVRQQSDARPRRPDITRCRL